METQDINQNSQSANETEQSVQYKQATPPNRDQANVSRKQVVKTKKVKSQFILKFFIFILLITLFGSTIYSLAFYLGKNGLNLQNFGSIFNSSNSSNSSQFRRENTSTSNAVNFGAIQFAKPGDIKTTSDIIKENIASVVSIRIKTTVSNQNVNSIGGLSAGTGFFVTSDGVIVTNRHVVAQFCSSGFLNKSLGSNSVEITGLTSENQAFDLDVLSIDPVDDVAILKVKNNSGNNFTPVKFADSSKVALGTEVLAIGNVLGEFANSVTKGIVSGLNRSLKTELQDECTKRQVVGDGLIQTDAAINQGNSGGPLFDPYGNVVGINTFGATQGQNIGFALPADTIIQAINSYKAFGKITKPQLGIVSRPLDPALKIQYSWLPSDYGELIYNTSGTAVIPNSGAQKAGLSEGDIILELNGVKIISDLNGNSPFRREILKQEPNSEITLTVLKVVGRTNESGYSYQNTPVEIKVKLGSIDFNLNLNSNI